MKAQNSYLEPPKNNKRLVVMKSKKRSKVSKDLRLENSLQEFEVLLNKHDWFYMMSDDSKVFRSGQESLAVIERQHSIIKMLDDGENQAIILSQQLWDNYDKSPFT